MNKILLKFLYDNYVENNYDLSIEYNIDSISERLETSEDIIRNISQSLHSRGLLSFYNRHIVMLSDDGVMEVENNL